MAREDSGSLAVVDVVALLRIVGAEKPAGGEAARILDGLCKLLPARGVEVGQPPDCPPKGAPGRSLRPAPSARGSARAALGDGGRRLCCVVGPNSAKPVRFEFRRDPRDRPFGKRELAIVAAAAGAGWLRRDEACLADEFQGLDRFDGFDKLTAGGFDKLTAGGFDKLTAGNPIRSHIAGALAARPLGPGRSTGGQLEDRLSRVLASLPLRQHQVLDGLCHGASEKEVARSLRLKVNTVKFHVKNLYRQFNVSSRGELTAPLIFGDRV